MSELSENEYPAEAVEVVGEDAVEADAEATDEGDADAEAAE